MDEPNYTLKLGVTSLLQILLAALIIVIGVFMRRDAGQQNLFWLVYILLGVIIMFRYFNMPKEIFVDNELVTFKNWFGKEKAAYIKDIKRINKRMNYLTVMTEEKKIMMSSGFKGLKKFAEDMKRRNPQVEIIGIK